MNPSELEAYRKQRDKNMYARPKSISHWLNDANLIESYTFKQRFRDKIRVAFWWIGGMITLAMIVGVAIAIMAV